MARPLIAPAMFGRLYNFYPSTVTIQEVTERQDTAGQMIGSWANKVGYVDLACRLAPADGKEIKLPNQTYVVATHTIAISGYYAGIDEKDRAVIDSVNYDILLVENDGQGESTRLSVEVVT